MEIYSLELSEYTGWPFGKKGNHNHNFIIPDGYGISRITIDILQSVSGGGLRFQSLPEQKAQGKQTVNVRWYHDAFGKIRYKISINVEPITATWSGTFISRIHLPQKPDKDFCEAGEWTAIGYFGTLIETSRHTICAMTGLEPPISYSWRLRLKLRLLLVLQFWRLVRQ